MSDEILTAHDRCDKRDCGAAGYFRAYFPVGELTFCKHHADEVDDHLLEYRWVDMRPAIVAKLDVSA